MYPSKKYSRWLPTLVLFLGVPIAVHAKEDKAVSYRAGYNEGYSIGYGDGQNDFRRGAAFTLDHHDYKDSDKGYVGSLGHKDEYKKGYQAGFRVGYQDGYTGRAFALYANPNAPTYVIEQPVYPAAGTVPVPVPVPSTATPVPVPSNAGSAFEMGAQIGYRDGMQQGLADLRGNQTYDPARHDEYRSATDGYSPIYGSKDDYEAGYRRGFEDGYRTGFGHH